MKRAAAFGLLFACSAVCAELAKLVNTVYQCDDKKIVVVEQSDPLDNLKAGKTMKVTIGYDEHELKSAVVVTGRVYRNDDGDVEWSTRNGETGELTDPKARTNLASGCKRVKS